MRLKRIYDHDAPKKKWMSRQEECATCQGKGVVVNETLDGVKDCPDCTDGVRTIPVPPVAGIEVQHVGASGKQNFSVRLINGGLSESWLSIERGRVIIHGVNKTLTYKVISVDRNQYECELITEEDV